MAYNRHSKKTLLAFLTALSISLGTSGCTNNNINDKESRKEISTQIDNSETIAPSPTLTPEEAEAKELEKLIDEYLTYFSSIEVEYPHEDLYPSEKDINKILAMDNTYQEYEHKDSISKKELYRLIKKNSTEYAEKHPEFQNPFDITSNSSSTNATFMYALEFLIDDLKDNATNDYLEDICKMKNLKIVFGDLNQDISSNGYYKLLYADYNEKKNRIILDSKAISTIKKKNKIDIYKDELKHELSHTKSYACKHRLKKGQQFQCILGESSTLHETYAESSTYALEKNNLGYYNVEHDDFTYANEREDESLILLLGLFHDDMTYEDYYNAISDANPEAFYDFCGTKSNSEKQKLYKILAAIDGRNFRNDIAFDAKNADLITKTEAIKSIRYNYRLDIFHKVLGHMVNYTATHSDFTIEKNLQILNMIENCILDDTQYYLNPKNSFDQKFIVDIYQSETKYLDFLSQYYFKGEKDSTTIKENYIDYTDFEVFEECIDDIFYSNDLLDEFPLLRPILFTHENATFSHEIFLEENKNVIKEKCKTK